MSKFFVLIAFLFSFSVNGQNLKGVDIIVRNYKEFDTLEALSNKIKNDFHSDIERVRAIYTWMANNLRYDDYFLFSPNRFIYTDENDLKEQLEINQKKLLILKKEFVMIMHLYFIQYVKN